MKILILTPHSKTNNNNKIELFNCTDRYQIYANLLIKYLSQNKDIELIIKPSFRKGKRGDFYQSISNLTYPYVDHIILIDKDGFRSTNPSYISHLRKYVTGAIVSIASDSTQLSSEDMLFYFNPNGLNTRNRTTLLNWIGDDSLMHIKKDYNSLNILISDCCHPYDPFTVKKDKTKKIIGDVINFMKKNNNIIDINISQLCYNKIQVYDKNGEIKETNTINFNDMYNEFSKTHIFFVTNTTVDDVLLSELAFHNVIIVAPKNYTHKKNYINFDIVSYDYFIPWREIMEKINGINTRNKMVDSGCTWNKITQKIYDYLIGYNAQNQKIIQKHNNIKNNIQHDFSDKLNISNQEKKKNYVILQSQIRKSNRVIKYKSR